MKSTIPLNRLACRLLGALALVAFALSAHAGRFWRGATADALFSETENWATSSGGAGGATLPGSSGDGTTYFRNFLNGSIVFDQLPSLGNNVRVDTASESPFVWRATEPDKGFATTGYINICEDADKSPAHLKIESGTYTAKRLRIGCASNATADLEMDGGVLNLSEESSVGGKSGCTAGLVINEGAAINTSSIYFYVGENGTARMILNGGSFTMANGSGGGLSLCRRNDGARGVIELNGGTLTIPNFRVEFVAGEGSAYPNSTGRIVFNGTEIVPTRTTTSFLNAASNLTCELGARGLVIDTAGFDIEIKHDLVPAEGVTSVPLVKKGAGRLTISGAVPFAAGDIQVYGGTAVVGGTTYEVNVANAIDASAGGDLGEVAIHREKLEGWLKDADFRNVAKYGATGTAMMEQPEPVVVDVNGDRKTYINLETGKTYNDEIAGTSFSFITEDLAPRTLQIIAPDNDPVENVRDIGSYPLLGGKKMNQGVILRGGHLDHFVNATAEQRAASFLTTLGLKTEIELRKASVDLPDDYKDAENEETGTVTQSFAASDCAYVYCGLAWGDDNGTQIRADDNGNFTNQIRKIFTTWGTPGNLPTYFHCRIGTDRTGIVGLLVLGLMGVEEEVLYRDYLMSNFANIGGARDTNVPDTFIRYLLRGNCGNYTYTGKDAQYGVSIASRVRQYLEMCGVTAEQLGVITEALSGETPDEVLARVNAYEQANGVRTVSYVPYQGSTDVMGMHRLAAGTHMLPTAPVKAGYTFKGWDVENEVDNGDGTAVVYAIWEVAARYWSDENGDEARFADGQSWFPAPESGLQADDLLVLNKGVDKVAKMEYGDAVTVSKLYVGWGTLDGGATMSAADDKGGRLDMTGGTLNVTDEFYIGAAFSDNSNNVVNVTGGHVTAGRLRTGECASNGGKSNTLNISGAGTVFETTAAETRFSTYNLGTTYVNVTDGAQFTSSQQMSVAYSGTAKLVISNATVNVAGATIANGGGSIGVVEVRDGIVYNNGNLRIGNASGASGSLTIDGGAWTNTSGTVYVGSASGGTGTLAVNAGEFYFDKIMRVGSGGYGRLVIGGTGVVVDGTSDNNYLCFGSSDSIIRLNAGGKLQLRSILRDNNANGVVEFNGGEMIKPVEQGAYGGAVGSTVIDEHHTVKILTGGMVFNTAGYKSKINGSVVCQENSGGIRKKGAGTLTISPNSGKTVSFNGPIYVDEGTLEFGSGVQFPADGFVDVVRVAPGATLKLPQGTVLTCRVWDIEGAVEGGTVTQEPDYGLKFASMIVWTGAACDDDIWNPENYRVCDQYGRTMYEQPITITADTPITVPHGADLPSFEGMNDVSYEITQDIEGMTVPDFLATAAAWYDPSDGNTLTFDVNNKVTGIQNKGSVGADLDLVLRSSSKDGGVLSNDKFFGQDSIYLSNASGYRSTGYFPADVQASGPRTMFAVANGGDMCIISSAQPNSNEEGRSLLLAQSGYNFGYGYQVSYYDESSSSWKTRKATFERTINEPYVYSGRTALGEGGYNTIMSSAIDAAGNENGNMVSNIYMPIPEEGENPQLRAYYGTFEINGFSSDATGYLGEALIFTNALTDAQMSEVQSYLKAKWLTMRLPEYERIVLNADVDLRGTTRTLEALYGGGSFTTGTIVLNGTLTIAVAADGSVVAPSFDRLVLGPDAKLVVKGAKNLPTQSTINIIPFNSIEGEFKTLEGDNKVKVRVYYAADRICARREAGFVLHLR